MKCLNFSQLISYQYQLLKDAEQQEFQQHLLSCPRCQKMVDEFEALQTSLKKTTAYQRPPDSSACYDDLELISFLEGRLKRRAQKIFHAHLARCHTCLDKLISVENLLYELKSEGLLPTEKSKTEITKKFILNILNTAGRKLRSLPDILRVPKPAYRWVGVIFLLALISIPFWRQQRISEDHLTTREPGTNQVETQIRLAVPPNGESVESAIPEFRWSGSDRFAFYSFLLLDAEGNITWEKKTDLTRLTLPPDIRLQPSMAYYWQVEAFFEDGGSVVSNMAGFVYGSR
jgi:hypothetical protein